MLNKRFLFVALCLAVWTAIAPAMVSARPLRADRANQWQSAVSALMTWWGIFDGAAERGTPARRTDRIKNGCGIDPNGVPLCEAGPGGGGMGGSGLQSGTEDPGSSGN